MRRAIIYSCLVGQLVILCLVTNAFESLTMFVLFGVVPWQSTPLSPHAMLSFYYLAAGTIITFCFRKQITALPQNLRTTRSQTQA